MSTIGQLYSLRGTVRLAWFRLRHRRRSLDRAISHLARAAARLGVSHPDRPLVLAALSNGLIWRYELTSETADLDDALGRLRDAIASPGVSADERGAFLGDLAAALRTRFIRYGRPADLDEAIEAATGAIRQCEDPTSGITNRALALLDRYERTADLGDLLGALRDARTPVRGSVRVALHNGLRLGVLVSALSSRYQYTDDPQDLRDAIAAGRKALATLSRVDPYRAQYAALLSGVLRLSDEAALRSEGVDMAEEALRDSSPEQVDHAYRLSSLSLALLMRHLSSGDEDDLRRAREVADDALASATSGNRPMLLQRVGLLARRWFDVTFDATALATGEQAIREAIEVTAAEHPMRDGLVCELVDLWRRHPDSAQREGDVLPLLVDAVRRPGPAVSLHNALRAAVRLAELGAESGDTVQALLGYRRAVDLLPTAAWPGLRRAVREARLAEAPRATDAVAQAVKAGEPQLAIELLEAGRSVIWSQQLDLRTDLSRLRGAAPELAERMNGIRGWFERPTVES